MPFRHSNHFSFDAGAGRPPTSSFSTHSRSQSVTTSHELPFQSFPLSTAPSYLQRNKTERARTGKLAQAMRRGRGNDEGGFVRMEDDDESVQKVDGDDGGGGRMGWGWEGWKRWMVNEGDKRLAIAVYILLNNLVLSLGCTSYALKDNYTNARKLFGVTFVISKASALVLHVNVALILFPVCRNAISLLRQTPLNSIIPFDHNITLHIVIGWSLVFWTVVHVIGHFFNFYHLAASDGTSVVSGWFLANFATGPGMTGWLMIVPLAAMAYTAREKKRRRKNGGFEIFWYTHHLYILFFILWQIHTSFCMIQPDRPPYCSVGTTGVFWKYWLPGGLLFISERVLRVVRGRQKTFVSKVIMHPSNVVEVQIKKEHAHAKVGQYIFLNCPEISYLQYHPFTLTSSPEESFLSCHIKVEGDWTTAFAQALGCDFPSLKKAPDSSAVEADARKVVGLPLHRELPRVLVDGPFGSASEDFNKFETILLVGAGIGVTPFASILKSIFYRLTNPGSGKKTRLSKVYFTWVIRDFSSAEWFRSLLSAIEEQDVDGRIEISIYLTSKISPDEMQNIMLNDVGATRDAITNLRAPTQFGRPNWDGVFSAISRQHPDTDVGVFFCGPPALSKVLHQKCNAYTKPGRTSFYYGKESF